MPYRNLTSEQMDAVKFNGNLLLTACPGQVKQKHWFLNFVSF
jgi:hypothetical protein